MQPYSVLVPYDEGKLGEIVETTLALYYWNEETDRWIKEPSTNLNSVDNAIAANPDHFSLWAILGEQLAQPMQHRVFLPRIE